MTLSQDNDTLMGGTSLINTLGTYFARYRLALYLVFATAGAEIFRIMASLPCTFMMLMCIKRAACR
jgi:hypothetical protein